MKFMEAILTKMLSEAPSMGVLIILVWLFLRSMERRDAFIKQLHDEHIDARRNQQESIKENTLATQRLTEALKNKI